MTKMAVFRNVFLTEDKDANNGFYLIIISIYKYDVI